MGGLARRAMPQVGQVEVYQFAQDLSAYGRCGLRSPGYLVWLGGDVCARGTNLAGPACGSSPPPAGPDVLAQGSLRSLVMRSTSRKMLSAALMHANSGASSSASTRAISSMACCESPSKP